MISFRLYQTPQESNVIPTLGRIPKCYLKAHGADRQGKRSRRSSASILCGAMAHTTIPGDLNKTHRTPKRGLFLWSKRAKRCHDQAREWGSIQRGGALWSLNQRGAWEPELTKFGADSQGDTFSFVPRDSSHRPSIVPLIGTGFAASFILQPFSLSKSSSPARFAGPGCLSTEAQTYHPWWQQNCVPAAWNIAHYLSHCFCMMKQTRPLIYHWWILLYALEGLQKQTGFTVENNWLLVSYQNA